MSITGRTLLRASTVVLVVIGLIAAWTWTPLSEWASVERLHDFLSPHRTQWYSFPLVLLIFVVAELLLVPVLALVLMCGLVFGAWPGSVYAMLGALISAVIPFYVGRWLGRHRLLEWGGAPVRKLAAILSRRGLIAVFLVRKIPAPYSLVNMLCGAWGVTLTDLLLGTLLGMATGVVFLTVLGSQLGATVTGSAEFWPAFAMLAITIVLVLPLQRLLNRRLDGTA